MVDSDRRPLRWQGNVEEASLRLVRDEQSLLHAYNDLLSTSQGVLIRVSEDGCYAGSVDSGLLSAALQQHGGRHD